MYIISIDLSSKDWSTIVEYDLNNNIIKMYQWNQEIEHEESSSKEKNQLLLIENNPC